MFNPDGLVGGAVGALIGFVIMLIMWSSRKERLGTIRCNRCHYVGPLKGRFVPYHGIKAVCPVCHGENWTVLPRHNPVGPTQTSEQDVVIRESERRRSESERIEREKNVAEATRKAARIAETKASDAALKAARIAERDRKYRAKGIEPGPWAWYKSLSDPAQAIVLGLAFAVPAGVIMVIIFLLQRVEQSVVVDTEKVNIEPVAKAPNVQQNENALNSSRKTSRSESADSLNLRGIELLKKGDFKHAIVAFTDALRLDPTFAKAYKNRAICFSELGDSEKELSDHCEAIRLNPKDADAYCRRSAYYNVLGAFDKAIADSNESIQLDPKVFNAYLYRGNANIQIGEFNNAVSDLTVFVASNPREVLALLLRAQAYEGLHEYQHVIQDASAVISLDPKNVGALLLRSLAHQTFGHYQHVIDDASAVISLDPKNDKAFVIRGLAYKALGHEIDAVSDFVQAIKLNPKNRDQIDIKLHDTSEVKGR